MYDREIIYPRNNFSYTQFVHDYHAYELHIDELNFASV